MKTNVRNYLLTILAVMPILLVSCEDGFFGGIVGEGEVVRTSLDVNDFDGFVSTIAADIYVSQGDEFEVVMEAQENIIENLNISWVRNGIWTIKYYHWVSHSKPVKFFITLPELTKVGLSGSGAILGETMFNASSRLNLSISGSGSIDLETENDEMNILISGSGDIYLAGKADYIDCSISGSGGVFAYDLATQRADVILSGSGDTRLNVEEYLDVIISGSGNVYYRGEPNLDYHISGSGKVKRVD